MISPQLRYLKFLPLLTILVLCTPSAGLLGGESNAAGPLAAYWEAPSGPGAEDGWTYGALWPAGSDEPRFILAAVVTHNLIHPQDFPNGQVIGFLYDATGASDEPLYYVEGTWVINARFEDPVGGGELTIWDFDGKPVGRAAFGFSTRTLIEGEWAIAK